jgi:hypothetical protein
MNASGEVLSSLLGLDPYITVIPALKRWAILVRSIHGLTILSRVWSALANGRGANR